MHVRCNHPGTVDIFGKWGYEYSAPLLLSLTSELKCLYRAHSHFSHLSVLTWLMIQSNRDDMGFRYSVCGLAEYLWFSSSRYVRFFSFPTRLHLHERMAQDNHVVELESGVLGLGLTLPWTCCVTLGKLWSLWISFLLCERRELDEIISKVLSSFKRLWFYTVKL